MVVPASSGPPSGDAGPSRPGRDRTWALPDHGRVAAGLSLRVVVAPPDDDAYGMAGTVALHAGDRGSRFVLVHATDGAAGDHTPTAGSPGVPFVELVDRLAGLMAAERPDVVGTFGPDGITGHPDHVRVGAATDAAFDRLAAQPGRAFSGWCTGHCRSRCSSAGTRRFGGRG